MKKLATIFAMLALAGCTSLQYAGTASYTVSPIVVDGKTYCCAVDVKNGKEIARLDATISKQGDNYQVQLHEDGVAAFKGQEIASSATAGAIGTAGKVAAAAVLAPAIPAALPAVGAALASPGLGAAAVGAGAMVGAQKLMGGAPMTNSANPAN